MLFFKKKANKVENTVETKTEKGNFEIDMGTYKVYLKKVGNNKMAIIQAIRNALGLSLTDTKNMVDNAPILIGQNIPMVQAKTLEENLLELDCEVELE